MFKAVSTNAKLLTSCLQSILIKKDAVREISICLQEMLVFNSNDYFLVRICFALSPGNQIYCRKRLLPCCRGASETPQLLRTFTHLKLLFSGFYPQRHVQRVRRHLRLSTNASNISLLFLSRRYECSQTIECGLPLSRVLDALQLLGEIACFSVVFFSSELYS
jgi:hypothetical protein